MAKTESYEAERAALAKRAESIVNQFRQFRYSLEQQMTQLERDLERLEQQPKK